MRIQAGLFLLWIALYVLALSMPFVVIDYPTFASTALSYGFSGYSPRHLMGYEAINPLRMFALGLWRTHLLVFGGVFIGWFGARKTALGLSIAALILGLQALSVHELPTGFESCAHPIPGDIPCAPLQLGVGYLIWISSLAVLIVYCCFRVSSKTQNRVSDDSK